MKKKDPRRIATQETINERFKLGANMFATCQISVIKTYALMSIERNVQSKNCMKNENKHCKSRLTILEDTANKTSISARFSHNSHYFDRGDP